MAFSDFLDEHLGESKDVGHELRYNCPFCEPNHDFKLYVKKATDSSEGLWHCKKCDRSGNPVVFVREYNGCNYHEAVDTLSLYDYEMSPFVQEAKRNGLTTEEILLLYMIEKAKTAEEPEEVEEVKLVPPPLPIGFRMDWDHPDAVPFLDYMVNRRGFSLEDIIKHNMGFVVKGHTETAQGKYVPLNNHVIFLTHDNEGRYQYWNSRSIEKDPRIKTFNAPARDHEYSKRTTVFNLNAARYLYDIVIVEGVPDALTIGPSGVATFGKQVSDEQVEKILRSVNSPDQHIYIMLDMDAKDAMKRLGERLHKRHENTFFVINPTRKDANDLGREETWKIIRNNSVKADETGRMLLYLN